MFTHTHTHTHTQRLGTGLTLWYDPRNGKRDMRFGTWNVSSRYRVGLLTAAAGSLATCISDSVVVKKVRWDKGGKIREWKYNYSMQKENKITN
jgi:hypothetical protein